MGDFRPWWGRKTVAEIMGTTEYDRKKKIANNTVEWWKDGIKCIRLHKTDIICRMPSGAITLNSGGWKTPTTKSRIETFTPYHIRQEKGVWYVNGHVFADGITFHKNGTVTGEGDDPKEIHKTSRLLALYAKGFCDALARGGIPRPSSGDCWFCSMRTSGGISLGEETGNTEHILSHMAEKYFVPSLLVNALEAYPQAPAVRHMVGFWFGYHNQDCKAWHDIGRRGAEKAIKRYLKRMLGIADN